MGGRCRWQGLAGWLSGRCRCGVSGPPGAGWAGAAAGGAGGPGVGGGHPFSTASWRAIWPTVFSRRTILSDNAETLVLEAAETRVLEAGLVHLVLEAVPIGGMPCSTRQNEDLFILRQILILVLICVLLSILN